MLLRDSQYLIENAPDGDLNSVVSGALDRLHYESDPCVKYDTKRKIWIYLHRARTEYEFERIHQEQQKAVKPKNPRKAHRERAKSLAGPSPTEVKKEPSPKPPPKRASKATTKPPKAAVTKSSILPPQASWLQVQSVDNSQLLPDISSVEVKTEPVENVIHTVNSIPTQTPLTTAPMIVQQRIISQGVQQQKSLITTASLAPTKVTKPLPVAKTVMAAKTIPTKTVSTSKTLPAVKTISAVKTIPATKTDNMDVNKSIMGKSRAQKAASGRAAKNTKAVKDPALSAVRRIVDTPITAGGAIRRIPDNPVPSVVQGLVRTTIPDISKVKKEPLLMDPLLASTVRTMPKKKVAVNTALQDAAVKASAKSLVKMITTQAGVRTVQSPAQVTAQQVVFLSEPTTTTAVKTTQQQTIQGQQLIVMKQPSDSQSTSSQQQMIVINQVDQQLTVKQQKQLQQLLSKQAGIVEQQPTMSLQQQQQIQQLLLAKQILAEQQKAGKVQQQQQHQQHVISTETQHITQQQLQLLLKQQQLQQSQQGVNFVTHSTASSVSQQAKGQIQTQAISLAQLQQQRIATSSSILQQPRVVAQVANQSLNTGVQVQASNLLKSQQMVAKVVTNAQGQQIISMESLLSHQKQLSNVPQTIRVATTSNKPGMQPQYTVVSVAQPRMMQATHATAGHVVTATVTASSGGNTISTPSAMAANLRMSGINLAHIGGKPVLLATKPTSQQAASLQGQNVLVTSQAGIGAGQTVLLASQGISSQALRTQNPGALTVLQQGNQQILLPHGFTASALNLKALQGLKVIPLTPTPNSKGLGGRQQVFARIINPNSIRPIVTSVVQTDQPSTSNPPASSD